MFHKNLMKIFYFPNNFSNIFFGDPCFYATLQTFRLVDCHNAICKNPILNDAPKDLVSVHFK